MELRGQDKETRMPLPSSFISYKNQLNKDSNSSAPPISSYVGERRDQTVHSDPNPHQTLDNDHPRHQIINPTRDPDPDPVSASTDTRSPTTTQPQQVAAPTPETISFTPLIRYKECLKNHAASMGGHVVDGCGEFMPSGYEGSPEALRCAACECHRSFHRKEINGQSQYALPSGYYYDNNTRNTRRRRLDPRQRTPLHQPIEPLVTNFGGGGPVESSNEDLNMFQFNGGGQPSQYPHSSKKRFRTKFNQEQKDNMMGFAEKVGWRIQKEDEEQLQQFCDQVGVKRRVFKVWMHNNKQATKRKEKKCKKIHLISSWKINNTW